MTGTNFDLGFLVRGAPPVVKSAFMDADGTTKRDVFKFTTGSIVENVTISTSGNTSSPFSLELFRDANNNGILDNGDIPRISLSDSNGANEAVSAKLSQGTYFAQTKAFATSDIFYTLRASRTNIGVANPLAAAEIPLGRISQDLQRRDRISDTDTADNFAFTLDGNSSLNIGVRELGSKKGDVNIRIVQDLNSNGFVDKNEVVVKGTSTLKGNVDTITGLNKAGDYILQVCQTQGNSQFAVNFDHSAA